jgi:hypothetical protein
MGLLSTILKADPSQVDNLPIERIVSLCGDGRLGDDTQCLVQLRDYFKQAKTENLKKHIQRCLQSPFENNGFVLQEIVNEFGRRLEYEVKHGLLHGKANAIGFDGLWHDAGKKHDIVVEVKTTDSYAIKIDDIWSYRDALIKAGQIIGEASLLLVLGREEKNWLEDAILGSGRGKKVRIISAEALANLVLLKESAPNTLAKIHDLLIPFDVVKLDRIIDIAFSAAEDAKASLKEEQGEDLETQTSPSDSETRKQVRTPAEVIAKFRDAMVETFAHGHVPLVKKSGVMYWSTDDERKDLRAVFAFSKQYEEKGGGHSYWYAYHDAWDQFISEGQKGFYILGCNGRGEAYALPFQWIHAKKGDLYRTEKEDKGYCQVFLSSTKKGMALRLKDGGLIPVDEFRFPVPSEEGGSPPAA